MHSFSRLSVVLLSGLALLGCTGEADWVLAPGAVGTDPAAPSTPADERAHLSSFQGLSSGLPSNAKPTSLAHLDGTLYLVSNGQLFSLASGAKAWTPIDLGLGAGEQVTSVSRVDLALYLTTTAGLLRLDWGSEIAARLAAAPANGSALVKKGGELLLATTAGLFASSDKGVSFVKRSAPSFFGQPLRALVASSAAARIFAAAQVGGLFYSDDAGATWSSGLVTGEVTALSAAGALVLVETANGTLRSDNYGNTFHATSLGAPAMSFGFSGTKAFAGTMTGVRVSDDGGKTWRDGNDGLPAAAQVSALLVAGPAVVASTPSQVFVAELN
jgi:hypothetical protein